MISMKSQSFNDIIELANQAECVDDTFVQVERRRALCET
jgi:hypothetical protein